MVQLEPKRLVSFSMKIYTEGFVVQLETQRLVSMAMKTYTEGFVVRARTLADSLTL